MWRLWVSFPFVELFIISSGNIRFPWFVQVVAVDVFYDIRLYLIFVWFLTMVYGRRFRQPRVQS